MHGFRHSTESQRRAPWVLLDDLRRLTVEHFSGLPDQLYAGMERELNASLETAMSRGLGLGGAQRDDLMLLKLLRQRSATQAMQFRELIGRLFDDFAGKLGDDEDNSGLRLVSEDELDFRLTIDRMAGELGKQHQRQLAVVERAIAELASAIGRMDARNPLEPGQLGSVLLAMYRDADLTPTLRGELVNQYRDILGNTLPTLYERAASLFGASGVSATPNFEHEMVEPRMARKVGEDTAMATPDSPESRTVTGAAHEPSAAGAPGTDAMPWRDGATASGHDTGEGWFNVPADAQQRHRQLRDLLQSWRSAAQAPAASHGHEAGAGATTGARQAERVGGVRGSSQPSQQRPWVEAEELDRVAQLIQADAYEPFERALARQQGLNEAIREHMGDAAHRLGIDLDQSSVSSRDADAIDLVGMLFEALASADGVRPEARALFARLVMTYVRIALKDDQLFMRPGHPGKRLIDAVAESVEGNPGISRQDRDLLDLARDQVELVAAEFNEDMSILEAATNELQPLLERQRRARELAERRSRDSAAGRERLQQARDRASVEVVRRVSGRSLTPAIFRFLTHYWRHHYELALLRAGADASRVDEAGKVADALLELDALATEPERPEVADRMLALVPQLLQCMTDSGLDRSASDDWLAGIARAVAFPDQPRQAQTLATAPAKAEGDVGGKLDPKQVARMGSLQVGDVLRLAEFDGGLQPVKVAWISESTAKILLVDRRGQRKLLASPTQLAALVGDGRLEMGRDEPPFERALRGVHERLAQGKGSS